MYRFLCACGVYGAVKLFDTAPGLILDSEGILDNSSGTSVGRIPWTQVRGFDIVTISRQRLLIVFVDNPRDYIRRSNFLKRPPLWANMKMFGSPITLAANALQINFEELVNTIAAFYEKYGAETAYEEE